MQKQSNTVELISRLDREAMSRDNADSHIEKLATYEKELVDLREQLVSLRVSAYEDRQLCEKQKREKEEVLARFKELQDVKQS